MLNDPDVLVGLITVINPDYVDPGKALLKTKANDYKSFKLSKGQYFIQILQDHILSRYLS